MDPWESPKVGPVDPNLAIKGWYKPAKSGGLGFRVCHIIINIVVMFILSHTYISCPTIGHIYRTKYIHLMS